MSKDNLGRNLTMEPNEIHIIIKEGEDGNISFEVVDTYDDNEANEELRASAMLMRCAVRGMVETILTDPYKTADLGKDAFVREGVLEPIKKETNGTTNNVIVDNFPKPVGNA